MPLDAQTYEVHCLSLPHAEPTIPGAVLLQRLLQDNDIACTTIPCRAISSKNADGWTIALCVISISDNTTPPPASTPADA
jgi:hypothetical protein